VHSRLLTRLLHSPVAVRSWFCRIKKTISEHTLVLVLARPSPAARASDRRWVLFERQRHVLPRLWRSTSGASSSKAAAWQPSFYSWGRRGLLQLFLGPELVGVAALLLAAVLGTRGQTGIADSADLLVLVILLRKHHQRRFNDAATQAQHQVKGRLCWAWGASALDRGWQAPLRRALVRHACRSPGPDQPTRGPLTLRCLHAHSCVLLSASHCLQANEPGSAAGRRVSPRQSAIPACLRI